MSCFDIHDQIFSHANRRMYNFLTSIYFRFTKSGNWKRTREARVLRIEKKNWNLINKFSQGKMCLTEEYLVSKTASNIL